MLRDDVGHVLDPQVCEQARLSRDPRFDGLFYTGVTTTHIYCRPVCPVPTVKAAHVRYFPSAVAAEAEGFRPCLICRPELAPGAWRRGDELLERSLKLIDTGLLADQPLAVLARRVGIGERQLRRLFVHRLGVSPQSVHATRRLLFAKQLLTETALPITDVALEAGFGSLRRFNASFRSAYRMAPSQLRRRPRQSGNETLTLRLGYRPPYDFELLLAHLRARALPGLEAVDGHAYARAFGPPDAPGWLCVSAWPGGEHALRLKLHCPQAVRILEVVTRVKRMFDLDADPATINAALSRDGELAAAVERCPGLRLPGCWDGFEAAVRTVLDRHAAVAEWTLAARLLRRFGQRLDTSLPAALNRLFPTAETLAGAGPDELVAIGLSRRGAATLTAIARAFLEGRVDFSPGHTLESFVARWAALPGLDVGAAHAIALHSLGHPDAFPADVPAARAERWRPWRAYAAMHLLQDAGEPRSGAWPPLHSEPDVTAMRQW